MEVYRTYDCLAGDIMVLRRFAATTESEIYCLLLVDVFSRHCWPIMLETRSADEITRKFEALLERLRPHLLRTTILFDQESAIVSRQFRTMLKKFDVQLQLSYTVTKASNAESLIRTLKRTLLVAVEHDVVEHNIHLLQVSLCPVRARIELGERPASYHTHVQQSCALRPTWYDADAGDRVGRGTVAPMGGALSAPRSRRATPSRQDRPTSCPTLRQFRARP
jgi:transposase InsO family protein